MDASGRFGLGTTSPSARLEVGSATPTEVGIRVRGAATQTAFLQAWENNSGTALAGVTAAGIFTGSGSLLTNLDASNITTGNLGIARMPMGGNWSLSSPLNVNSGHLFLNQANSSVGIGTTSPTKKLDVAGSVKADTVFSNNLSSNSPLALQAPAGTTRMFIDDVTGNVGIGTSSPGNATQAGRRYLGIEGPTDAGVLEFTSNAADADGATIGTIQWTDKNSINPERRSGAIVNRLLGTTANNRGSRLEFWTKPDNATFFERMRIDDKGNVGIGTTSPGSRLHISRSSGEGLPVLTDIGLVINNNQVSSDIAGIQLIGGSIGDGRIFFGEAADGQQGQIRYSNFGNFMQFSTMGSIRAMIDNVGNVGLGTTSPQNRLDVEGGAVIGTTYSGTNTAPANGLLVEGNVGIGTTTPTAELHVKAASLHGNVRIESAGGTVLNLDANDLSSVAVGTSSMVPLTLNTSNAVRVRIEADGDVGIGGVAPATRLQVAGGQLSTDAGTVSAPAYSFSGDLNTGIYRPLLDAIGLVTGGTERVQIESSGDVGIGTLTPGTKLDVEQSGTYVAHFNRTTSDGPVIGIQQDGIIEGNISVSGTTVSYNAFTGSHYGWTEEALERGELVTLTGTNRNSHDNPKSEIIYGIRRSSIPNDPACLGSYLALSESNQPYSPENPHLIMAVGNGEMWVVDEGGNIEPGDYLISSSTPGHAMRDDESKYPIGHIVARAAEGLDWSMVSETIGGRKHKKISVLFGNFVRSNVASVNQLLERQQKQIERLEKRLDEMEAQKPQAKVE